MKVKALHKFNELLLCLTEHWQEDVMPTVHSKPGWAERWEGLCQGFAEGNVISIDSGIMPLLLQCHLVLLGHTEPFNQHFPVVSGEEL